jgi:hypothetical protein
LAGLNAPQAATVYLILSPYRRSLRRSLTANLVFQVDNADWTRCSWS